MYSGDEREKLREALIEVALGDKRLSGVALCGSAAAGTEDLSSDIDLVLGVADQGCLGEALAEWTELLCHDYGAVHHVDILSGARVFRAFLLPSTLEVDLNFVRSHEFGAEGPRFRLLRGEAVARPQVEPPDAGHFIGMGWLYARQARSCLGRGRCWQAGRMVSGVSDQALALACLRHGLPTLYGAAVDQLPPEVLAVFEGCPVRTVELPEVRRAFGWSVARLLDQAHQTGGSLDDRFVATLQELAGLSGEGE